MFARSGGGEAPGALRRAPGSRGPSRPGSGRSALQNAGVLVRAIFGPAGALRRFLRVQSSLFLFT